MADAGETRESDLGNVAYDDTRTMLLVTLMADGDITKDEALDVLKWTRDDTDPKRIIGVIAGELGVATGAIEKRLEGTDWEMQGEDIEATGRGFNAWKNDVGETFIQTGNVMGNFLAWPERKMADWAVNAGQLGGGVWSDWDQFVGRNLTGSAVRGKLDEYNEGKEDRTRVRDQTRQEIDRLLEDGKIGKDEAKDLRNLTGDYGSENYEELEKRLRTVYDKYESEEQGESRIREGVLRDLIMRQDAPEAAAVEEESAAVAGATQEYPEQSYDPQGNPIVESPSAIEEGVGAAPTAPESDVDAYLRANGYNPQEVEGVDYGADTPRSRYFSEDFVYDPSTGRNFSSDQWAAIKLDPRARADYIVNKQVEPSVERLLNSGRFNVQERTDAEGKGTGEYYETVSSGGQGHIPIEDLAIPSPVVTNPWETSTYDYKVGSGRAEWMGMSKMMQKRYIITMKQQGLISEDQYDDWTQPMIDPGNWSGGALDVNMNSQSMNLTAMSIYERATSLSSQFQRDPLTALSAMGQEARQYRASRGSGRSAPKYSVPASLREIPDYKTLATRTKGVFSAELGRDMEDWELGILADELKGKYEEANRDRIAIHKEAWNDAVAGGSTEVDFGEVEEPLEGLEFDIGEKYGAEIDRYERVEDRANSRRQLIDSISVGERMI